MFRLTLITLILWMLTLVIMPSKASMNDPTRPPAFNVTTVTKKAVDPRWVLSSTLVSREHRNAVINNRVVSLGDVVSGARVVEIEPMRVVLNRNGQQIVLMLLEKNIKQPAKSLDLREGQ